MVKLSPKQSRSLFMDITAFLTERHPEVVCTERQIGQLLYLCLETDINPDYGLTIHLAQTPLLKDLFAFLRTLVEAQKKERYTYNLILAARVWIEEVHPELVPPKQKEPLWH